jgi:hypothetical protein
MTGPGVEQLFDEYALRYVRGERPDVRDYLDRAGAEREALGRMLDRFLQFVPAQEPSEEDVVLLRARVEQEPPLLLLRLRRKLTRDAVVDALVGALGLDPAKREKVDGYYHRLETGLLEPGGVNRRVWDALGGFLSANVRALAGLPPLVPTAPARAYLRKADYLASWAPAVDALAESPTPAAGERPPDEPDEIDRLFTAGP